MAHAEIILTEPAAPESGLAALRSGRRGVVRVTAFASAARNLVAPLWQRLADSDPGHPGLSLRLSVREPDQALDELHKGSTDLALVHSYTVLLALVADLPWLTPGPETSCYEMIQRACGAAGFVPDIRARSSDFGVLTALAAAGAGVTLIPRMALPDTADALSLSVHPLLRPVSRSTFTVSRAGTGKRPDLRRVRQLLHDSATLPEAG